MKKKLIIFGLSNIAEVAYEYFTNDSDYEVVAFCADEIYLDKRQKTLFELPVISLEQIIESFPPSECDIFVAIGSQKLNRSRTKKVSEVKLMGYNLASYISSRAFVWPNVKIGTHVFILENNTIQPFVEIGDNVFIWSHNHIGHASVIENNCFISSQAVISGHCRVGKNSFIGINASIADTVCLGSDNFIGMSVNIPKNTKNDSVYRAPKSILANLGAKKFNKVKE